ncbi:MAG: hypothetical protein LBS19_03210, partial [Clostridiales bacterium]|nr:hypothetical protein [Clostridiales bacterium]
YEIKRGKYISFRAPEQERFTRAKTLGVDYSEDALKQKISRNTAPIINTKTEPTVPVTPPTASAPKLPPKIPALNGGLLQRIKVIGDDLKRRERGEAPKPIDSYDLKLMQEYGGSEGVLTLREQCRRDMAELQNSMDAAGERIQKLSNLLTNIADYNRTKPIYKQYKETRLFSERFRKKHAEDIEAHECAKSRLEKVKRPLPKVKDIDKKIAELKETNAESSRRYSQKDREYRDWGKLHSYFRSLETRLESPPSQRRDPARHVKSNDLSL